MSEVVHLETRLDRLWREFNEAREKAQASDAIEDGIACGRAWSRFLAEFVPDGETRRAVHGNAVQSQP